MSIAFDTSNDRFVTPPSAANHSFRVRELLTDGFARREGLQTLGTLARQFGMSARTLQRALRASGASYVSILTQARMELARAWLARGERVGDVAVGLGYADQTAFSRAFRRWTGTSPSSFRHAHRGQAPVG